ncbi:hypothetical protein RRG08_014932 [Elysia crispata]|uniref:Uncharacterized protein n=1 Tax=Elysia crispata TaxID=231223 RepID=A0AAE1B024_9GAST|nr:hypothetical protein RRG08_014932 [Elysia crispata]
MWTARRHVIVWCMIPGNVDSPSTCHRLVYDTRIVWCMISGNVDSPSTCHRLVYDTRECGQPVDMSSSGV